MDFSRIKKLLSSFSMVPPDEKETVREEPDQSWKVHVIHKASMFCDPRNCAIYNRTGQIEPQLFWSNDDPASSNTPESIAAYAEKKAGNRAIKRLKGTTLCLHTRYAPNNYYHWMVDLLPRIDLFRRSRRADTTIDRYFVPTNPKNPYQRESLELLGIPTDRAVFHPSFRKILFDSLIVPDMAQDAWDPVTMTRVCHRWQYEFLRRSFLPHAVRPPDTGRRGIYIRRSDSRVGRQILNEDEVEKLIKRYDIEPVSLAGLDFVHQIGLFSTASLVVGLHGAGLTNLVFCPWNTMVVEISLENFSPDCFRQIADKLGFRRAGLTLPAQSDDIRTAQFQNVRIDIKHLEATLEKAFITG